MLCAHNSGEIICAFGDECTVVVPGPLFIEVGSE